MKPLIARLTPMEPVRTAEEMAAWIDGRRTPTYRLALAILARTDLAEDATQDAMIAAHRAIRSLACAENPEGWMRKVAVRCAMRTARRFRFERIPDEVVDRGHDGDTSIAVRQVLARLSPDHRAILALAMFEQLRYDEIASILGIRQGTVASRLHAAKAAFRRHWEEA